MRVLVIGDIGAESSYHAGDEAMAVAAVDELRLRDPGLEVVAVSGAPAATTARYGWSAVPRCGFAALVGDAQRDARLAAVLAAGDGRSDALGWSDPAWTVIEAVGRCDAVLVTGGGNLNSTWPEHVYERAALAGLARQFGRPLVVTGQSIGPHLARRHGELTNDVVTSAALVGARERRTYATALALGVPAERLRLTTDDAKFLVTPEGDPAPEHLAATFAAGSGLVHRDVYVRRLGALVAHAHRSTGLPVRLVAHDGSLHGKDGDTALHEAVREAAGGTGVEVVPFAPGQEPAAARAAQLVLSTRYHPVVWALSAGVPALAVATDAYTRTKIAGTLELDGLGALCVGPASLVGGAALDVFDEVWARREELTARHAPVLAAQRASSAAWWDAVHAALSGGPAQAPDDLALPEQVEIASLGAAGRELDDWSLAVSADVTNVALAGAERDEASRLLHARVEELELEVARLGSAVDEAADEAGLLRENLRAAHELNESPLAELAASVRGERLIGELEKELADLRATRTFRYLAPFRAAWGLYLRRRSGTAD